MITCGVADLGYVVKLAYLALMAEMARRADRAVDARRTVECAPLVEGAGGFVEARNLLRAVVDRAVVLSDAECWNWDTDSWGKACLVHKPIHPGGQRCGLLVKCKWPLHYKASR